MKVFGNLLPSMNRLSDLEDMSDHETEYPVSVRIKKKKKDQSTMTDSSQDPLSSSSSQIRGQTDSDEDLHASDIEVCMDNDIYTYNI